MAVENHLNYSLSSRKWEWDEDLIQNRTISDGVADLLTRKLLRLPKDVLSALHVMSCFGSEVSLSILKLVNDVCGNTNVIANLNHATNEGLTKKTNKSCSFVHDMIQQAVHRGIKPDVRVSMLKEIAETLLIRSADERGDSVLFILVDLINRVGPDRTTDVEERIQYASLNLIAGEKAIQTPDFASALMYLEAGISFLVDDHWKDHYNVSLNLFKNSALVYWAQGKTDLMNSRLDEVFNNAR